MNRTAIVAAIPIPPELEAIRQREVLVARLAAPAHVTLLSPFLEAAAVGEAVIERLRGIAASVAAFDVTFAEVRRWEPSAIGPGAVWLAPEPATPFTELTRSIWAAYPEAPPYGDPDTTIEPHLTLAVEHPDRFDRIEARALASLPFRHRVRFVSLLVERPDGRWRTSRRLALG